MEQAAAALPREHTYINHVEPLWSLWQTTELDVAAGDTVVTAGLDQTEVFVVLHGHGAVRAPHERGQDAAYGVSTGAPMRGPCRHLRVVVCIF